MLKISCLANMKADPKDLTIEDEAFKEALGSSDSCLDNLASLAALIRKAGSSSHLSRADRSFDPTDPKHNHCVPPLYH